MKENVPGSLRTWFGDYDTAASRQVCDWLIRVFQAHGRLTAIDFLLHKQCTKLPPVPSNFPITQNYEDVIVQKRFLANMHQSNNWTTFGQGRLTYDFIYSPFRKRMQCRFSFFFFCKESTLFHRIIFYLWNRLCCKEYVWWKSPKHWHLLRRKVYIFFKAGPPPPNNNSAHRGQFQVNVNPIGDS